MGKTFNAGYNQRLFSGGWRSRIHLARYAWLQTAVSRFVPEYETVLELGCFDGKAIDYLPHAPTRYQGLDANWERGLELAAVKWRDEPDYTFRECHSPAEAQLEGETFDVSVCMETMEHVPPDLVDGYLELLAASTKLCSIFTVPVEIGPVLAVKHPAKMLLTGAEKYSLKEYVSASLGRVHSVQRNQHKGFDYRHFVAQVERYFDVLLVEGHPFSRLPPVLGFGVGIVARPR